MQPPPRKSHEVDLSTWTFFASTTRTRRSTARSLASLPSTGTNHVPPPNTVAAKSCTRPTVWLARTRPAASWWATSFALASRRWSGKSEIVGAGLSPADFRFLFCLND
eukprot:scaffold79977_cov71-Phaeocystis_antarctica.AAC.2